MEDKMKVPAILNLMGATTYKFLKNLATPNIPSELTYQDIVKLLSEHLNPKPLEMTERFGFYKRKQFEGESIANYCAELQKLLIHCNFGNNLSTMLRDKLVMGLKNENIQKKLLAEDKLTYEKAKSIALAMESAQRDVCEIQNQMVSIKKLHSSQDKTIKKDFSKFKKSEPTKKFDKSRKCYRCDSTQHLAHECKHKNTQCRNCLKNGHLAKVCCSKRNKTVKQIESCSETVPVNSVKSPQHARDKILLEIFVEGNKCLFELDTGAAISCMNVNEFKKLCPDVAIKPTKLLLKNFDNSMITSAGHAVMQIQYKDQINTETIYLVHAKVNAVFGREWLVAEDIIEPVTYSDWATPIVPVIKQNGNLRICGDYKVTINPGLKIEQYPLPRIEDIFAELSGGEFFTKIDLSEAYLQMLVDEQDRHLLTINTHKGLFRYKRRNYGIALAPAVWQRAIEQVLSGIAGVHVFLDDITVTGRNDQEHFERLELVLQILEEYGLRVNKRKSEFFKKSVNYCGHTIDKFGLHKTQEKIDAITKKGTKFLWTAECEKAFKALKQEIASDRILCHYDPKLPLVLQTDASPVGIGAVLSHIMPDGSEKPAMFASSYTIKYRNTKNHGNADALSRLPLAVDKDCEYLTEADVTNISQVELMPVTATDIARATKTDRKLFELYESLKSGTELPVPWKGRESEFSLQNGCIMYGHRVCIPEKYQNQVLEELHVGHPGIVKMKAIARSYCYWQGIDASIANFVQNCSACIATRNEPARINRHPWEWPNGPWQRIHVDYAGPFMGKMFFVVSDAYSKLIEVIPMKNITASFTIHHLRILFAHYGIPLTLRHVDQIRKCGKSIELSQAVTEIPIYDKELNFPDEPVSDDAESEPPVPEVVPEPKDVPVPATPSDDIPPKPVPDVSGKPKTDVPLRRSNRIRRPPKRLDLKLLALESLGRTQEKFADFLEPLVESCLPEAVLRVWERCRNAETTSEGQDSGRSLDRLMTFLRKEVESEEMILLARTGLGSTQRQKVKANAEEPSLATSAALVNTKGERSGKPRSCLFCSQSNHWTSDCLIAKKLSLNDKKSILIRN
ncbi:uncharacterized protein K02A2.6 [Trichonephila clavipes]|nr:uncharacterized protein K02A2.6 [Trichonephila clavipes]